MAQNPTTLSVCGTFTDPDNPDQGQCYPVKVSENCSAPTLPVIQCDDDEYTVEYQPDNTEHPFRVVARVFDEACLPITDESDQNILTYIV